MDGLVMLVILVGALLVALVAFFSIRSIVREQRQTRSRSLELAQLAERLGWQLRQLDAGADGQEIETMLWGTTLHAMVTEGRAGFDLMTMGELEGHQIHLFDVGMARRGSLQTPALAALMLLSPDGWTAILARPAQPLPRFYLQPEPLANPIGDLVGRQAAEDYEAVSSTGGPYRLDAHRAELARVSGLLEHPLVTAGTGYLFVESTGDRLLVHDLKRFVPAADVERSVRDVTSFSGWLAAKGGEGS